MIKFYVWDELGEIEMKEWTIATPKEFFEFLEATAGWTTEISNYQEYKPTIFEHFNDRGHLAFTIMADSMEEATAKMEATERWKEWKKNYDA